MVGRSGDQTRLADVLAGRTGERAVVLVGDAGIGKSRLLLEVEEQFTETGGIVLQGNCLPCRRRCRSYR